MAKKYLCIQRSERLAGQRPSASEMQEMYARFDAWREKFAANIVDLGGRLGPGAVVRPDGAVDGPFVEAKEVIGGFMIVQADSLDQAMQVARECPGVVRPGSSVEVREIVVP